LILIKPSGFLVECSEKEG